MDPEYNLPEREDDMPPIDDALREAMEDLVRKLEKCDRLQKLLALLSTVCFWNIVGMASLFTNVLAATIWGNYLSNRAEKLIGRAYPWIKFSTVFYEPDRRHHSIPWARIKTEAEKGGDQLTLRIMRFANFWREVGWCLAGVLGYLAALLLFGGFMKDFMI